MSRTVNLHGNAIPVSGEVLSIGQSVPNVVLSNGDLEDVEMSSYLGKPFVISVVPSLDTPVCQVQTKKFNEEINVPVVTVSRDLPFAQKRWCGAEGIESVVCLSDYKHRTFGSAYGVDIEALGLLARAALVVDAEGKIVHIEYVSEVSEEPNYEAVKTALSSL